MVKRSGWKPIPLSLKVIFVLSILWMIGSLFAIPMRFTLGLPFFGFFITGVLALIILMLLDVVGPLFFLLGVWRRKWYGYLAPMIYITIFVLNSIVALFTMREKFGIMPIIIPMIAYANFLFFITKKKSYFK